MPACQHARPCSRGRTLARLCAAALAICLCAAASGCSSPHPQPTSPVTLRSADATEGLSLQLVVTRRWQPAASAAVWKADVTLHNARATPVFFYAVPFQPGRPEASGSARLFFAPITLNVSGIGGRALWTSVQPGGAPGQPLTTRLEPTASLHWQISLKVYSGAQSIELRTTQFGDSAERLMNQEGKPGLTNQFLRTSVTVAPYVGK
jgi:hypothetical protein